MKKIITTLSPFSSFSKGGFFLFVCLLTILGTTYGRASTTSAISNKAKYKTFKNIYLPVESNIINTIFQDNIGIIWIGTKRGIFSYNGYKLDKLAIHSGVEYANVTAIIQIDEKFLCIGTENGLYFYNLLSEQIENPYPLTQSIKSVRSLILWNDKIWFGTNNEGLKFYDLKDNSLRDVPLEKDDNKSIVYSLAPADGKLYIGAYDGLSCYDPIKNSRKSISFSTPFHNPLVNSLLWDKQSECLWIGTEGHLFQYFYNTSNMQLSSSIPSNSFKTLIQDSSNNLVLGTDNGLYTYDIEHKNVNHIFHDSRNNQSLCNNVIWCSFSDKNNNIWLGTDYGISLMMNNSTLQFIHISEMTGKGDGNEFTDIHKDSSGNYWLGGVNGLLYFGADKITIWFNTENQSAPLLHNRIRRIYEDREHTIWIATDGGIARYDITSQKFVYYTIIDKKNQKKANWVYDIYEDEENNLWVATYLGGLFIIDKHKLLSDNSKSPVYAERNLSDSAAPSKVSNIIYQIQADNYGFIWVNTQKGLVKIDSKTKQSKSYNIYLDKMIYDGKKYIWFSSNNELFRINIQDDKVEKIDELSKDNKIHAFVLENNNLWASSTEGLIVWDINTLQKTDLPIIDQYYQSGFYDKQHNVISWGGYDGIIYLYTKILSKKIISSPVVITSVGANNKKLLPGFDYKGNSIKYQNQINLPYSKRNLTFEFSTLDYNSDSNKDFYYRLEGEDTWSRLDPGQNSISFASLFHGKYNLFIRNGSSDDSQISPITRLEFTILPPWYLSWGAYTVYVILLSILIITTIGYFRRKIRRKYKRIERQKTLELSNLKMDFFIHISHELKTPLSLIIAPLSSLITETKKPETKRKLELIYKNSLKLNMLIHKVLDFKQIDHESEYTLIRSNVELCSFINNILETHSSAFSEKNIQATLISNVNQIWMDIDRIKIESVFQNILTNAIKFIPDTGGKIEISLSSKEKEVVIQILDTGSGIKKEDLPYVFIRFFQSKSKTSHKNGSGIGLYIVRKFIELHEGQVEIISAGENRGTLVTITLPLLNKNKVSFTENSVEVESPSPIISNELPLLLIIDDNDEIVYFLTEEYSKEYSCISANNGKEGLALACEQHPDIIILDYMMPEMDGLEFCKSIRKHQPTSSIPIIMLTAKDDEKTKLESIRNGIDSFMAKPFSSDELSLRIKQLLQSRQAVEKKLRIDTLGQPTSLVLPQKQSADEFFMADVIAVIEEYIENSDFNVAMLSSLLKLEKKQLYRKIKQITGITPVELIRQIRMRKAAMILSQKRFSISEVMYMVGYTNPSYFSKCFLEEFKVLPSQYITTIT